MNMDGPGCRAGNGVAPSMALFFTNKKPEASLLKLANPHDLPPFSSGMCFASKIEA